jgi:hypothetical protein
MVFLAGGAFTDPGRCPLAPRGIPFRDPACRLAVEILEDRLLLSRGPGHTDVLVSVAAVDDPGPSAEPQESHKETTGVPQGKGPNGDAVGSPPENGVVDSRGGYPVPPGPGPALKDDVVPQLQPIPVLLPASEPVLSLIPATSPKVVAGVSVEAPAATGAATPPTVTAPEPVVSVLAPVVEQTASAVLPTAASITPPPTTVPGVVVEDVAIAQSVPPLAPAPATGVTPEVTTSLEATAPASAPAPATTVVTPSNPGTTALAAITPHHEVETPSAVPASSGTPVAAARGATVSTAATTPQVPGALTIAISNPEGTMKASSSDVSAPALAGDNRPTGSPVWANTPAPMPSPSQMLARVGDPERPPAGVAAGPLPEAAHPSTAGVVDTAIFELTHREQHLGDNSATARVARGSAGAESSSEAVASDWLQELVLSMAGAGFATARGLAPCAFAAGLSLAVGTYLHSGGLLARTQDEEDDEFERWPIGA